MEFMSNLVGLVMFMFIMLFFMLIFSMIVFHPPWWYWREQHTSITVVQQPTQPTQPPPTIQYHIHLNQAGDMSQLSAPQSPSITAQRPETVEGEYRELGAPRRAELPAPNGEDEFVRIQRALGAPRATRQLPHRRG